MYINLKRRPTVKVTVHGNGIDARLFLKILQLGYSILSVWLSPYSLTH